jgi:hypothetical protein
MAFMVFHTNLNCRVEKQFKPNTACEIVLYNQHRKGREGKGREGDVYLLFGILNNNKSEAMEELVAKEA